MRYLWGHNAYRGGLSFAERKRDNSSVLAAFCVLKCPHSTILFCHYYKGRELRLLSLRLFEDSQPSSFSTSLTVERLPFLDRFAMGITLAAIRLEDIANSGHFHFFVPLTSLKQACLGKFLFGPLPAVLIPIPKIAMALYRLQYIACHTRLVKICGHGLDDERILGQFNRLVTTPKVPTGACRQERVRVDSLRFLGRLGVSGVF